MPRNYFSQRGGPYFINDKPYIGDIDPIGDKKVFPRSRFFSHIKDEIHFHIFMWSIKRIPRK